MILVVDNLMNVNNSFFSWERNKEAADSSAALDSKVHIGSLEQSWVLRWPKLCLIIDSVNLHFVSS